MTIPILPTGIFARMGPTELLIILAIALLIFGPKNLPKLGETIGKTVKGVRDGFENSETNEPDEASVIKELVEETEDDDDEYEEVVIRRKKKSSSDE